MSQLTALPRPTARAARPARPARAPQAPRLRLVETKDVAEHSGAGFVVLCVLLLVGGLIGLLLLNTNRAQESFAIEKLQAKSANLTDQQQQLSSQIDAMSGPQQLALRAQGMGLRPATKIRYVRKSDGAVLGVAKRSSEGSALTVDTLPSTPASRAAGAAVRAASSGLLVVKPLAPVVKAKPDSVTTSTTAKKGATKHSTKPSTTASKHEKPAPTSKSTPKSTSDNTSGRSSKSTK